MIIILMGVSAVGKTTVGQALAQRLHWTFVDADDYHPPANITKMRAGISLEDDDRAPWLKALHEAIESWIAQGRSVVLACSALKESYRQHLLVSPDVNLIFLRADFDVVSRHLAGRHGHFMSPALLESQFEALEPPQDAIAIDTANSVPDAVNAICSALGLAARANP
ncbi:MAG: gluconokinase [Candidatus Eremiobacteraeota bacterium]|nr:gluconokinase [Candidatus Eremiobacteraeota bacterium]